ncbi:MAG: hypothetical protein V2A73_07830, partial [Pseudomonadota bacterium]
RDGTTVVSAGADRKVRIWDARTLLSRGELQAESVLWNVLASFDGALVAVAASNGSVYVWDRTRSWLRAELRGHEGEVRGIAFSVDGRVLFSGGADGTVRRWNLATHGGTILGRFDGRIARLAVSPDGRFLGIPDDRGTVRLLSLATGQTVTALRGHRRGVTALVFAPDSELAASCGFDGTVRTWRVASGRPYWRAPLLLRSPPSVFTHLGWSRLDGADRKAAPAVESWRRAVEEQARIAAQTIDDRPVGDRSASSSVGGSGSGDSLCLLTYDDELQLWSTSADRLLASVPLNKATAPGPAPAKSEDAMTGWPSDARTHASPGASPGSPAGEDDAPKQAADTSAMPAPAFGAERFSGRTAYFRGMIERANGHSKSAMENSTLPQLAATRRGCLVLGSGRAFLLNGGAAAADLAKKDSRGAGQGGYAIRELTGKASAIAFQEGRILVATGDRVLVLDENGNELTRAEVEQGVSALGLVGGGRLLVVGYDAGDLELLPIVADAALPRFSFEERVPAAVERISEGPRQTIVVGYASGDLGIWSVETGKRLRHFKLHGPIVHLFVDGTTRRLYAATEVGDFQSIDLTSLYQDYCELLGDIWKTVPVVWQAGMPALVLPPAGHRCIVERAH